MATNTLTVPSPPSTTEVASRILAFIAAQTGVLTDLIPGSIIRTFSEALGSVISINAVELQAEVLQAILYGGYSAFNVVPLNAVNASGIETFATSANTPYPSAAINIVIPANTLLQTSGGVQFQTLSDVTLLAGTGSITANIQAVLAGSSGNVGASAITTLITPLQAVVYPINLTPTTGGADAESIQQTASRFANVVAQLQLSSPQAIASAVIGVTDGSETVKYATTYEPWVDQGAGPYTDGFTVFIDNGGGGASSSLVSTVTNFINGDLVNFSTSGYRPAGVNYAVSGGGAVDVNVSIAYTPTAIITNTQVIDTNITNAVESYFNNLAFGATAQLPFLSTPVSNSVINDVTELSVQMFLSSAPSSPVSAVTAASTARIILSTLTITLN